MIDCKTECKWVERCDAASAFKYHRDTCPVFGKKEQVVSNADHIRSMTDEELATFLCEYGGCPCVGDKFCERGTRCEDAVLMWLKQECDT